jgi:ATP-dependent RNA helicase DDX46/PRP5
VVCKDVEQHVAILEDDAKFFKLLELLGLYSQTGSIIVFVDKQENADSLLKDLMKASYSCMSLHGGELYLNFRELCILEQSAIEYIMTEPL